jgi:hypothetical protein
MTQVCESLKSSKEKRLAKEKTTLRITEPDYGNFVTLAFEIQLEQCIPPGSFVTCTYVAGTGL